MADDARPVKGPRSDLNTAMLDTLFLYGGNAAYVEQMQAAYARNPSSVPQSWRDFFAEVGDEAGNATRNADGASWKRDVWPAQDDEAVAVFDGNWSALEPKIEKKIEARQPGASPEDVTKAVKDSVRALMMIR